ncbi:hypothetical protein ABEP17_14405 [Priestia flexa]|uniref:hypothetical protein n=1 Tax=Priestia flexa TaxID=86664 RepID=UPI003D285225
MKFQLTCPSCKHEFKYDRGYLERNIKKLGEEIQDILSQVTLYKAKPANQRDKKWRANAQVALDIKRKQIRELKEFKRAAEAEVEKGEFAALKDAIKQLYGQEGFLKCIEIVNEQTKAYNISDSAKTVYTRQKGHVVTSVNKI